MGDQDKPIGFEYIITVEQYNELPEKEKKYWHYHKTEFPRAEVRLPDLTKEEAEKLMPVLNETYGKVIYVQTQMTSFLWVSLMFWSYKICLSYQSKTKLI